MGCSFSSEVGAQVVKEPVKFASSGKVGEICLRMHRFWLRQVEEKIEKLNNLFFKIRFANQEHYYPLSQSQQLTSHLLKFPINSSYRPYGRFLLIQLWTNVVREVKDTGFGMVLLDPFINGTSQRITRCHLNYKDTPAGFLDVQIIFKEYPQQELSLKINCVIMRMEEKIKQKLAAKIIIGEEMIQAEAIRGKDSQIIYFHDNVYHFRVPSFLTKGQIIIIEKKGNSDIFRGKMDLNLQEISDAQNQYDGHQSINEDGSINGRVIFSCLKGFKKSYHFHSPQLYSKNSFRLVSIKGLQENLTETHLNLKSSRDNGTENTLGTAGSGKWFDVQKMLSKSKIRLKKRQSLLQPIVN